MVEKRRLVILLGAAALVMAAASPAMGYLSDLYGHWAAPLVGAMEAKGIVSGDDFGRFRPEASLTRAELAKLLVSSLGYQEEAKLLAEHPSRFADVPRWHWANGFIEALAETGTAEGFPDGRFEPEQTVSRAQLAVMLVRAAGYAEQARLLNFETSGYTDDDDVPDWARGAVNVARATGLMDGFEDGTFRPLQPVTRAEGSVALFRFMDTRGTVFHLTGTLLAFDPATSEGVLRDDLGEEHTFVMDYAANYYRDGRSVPLGQIAPLDQVWVVVGPDGAGRFMEARYADIVGSQVRVTGQTLHTTDLRGEIRRVTLEPGALVFLNGARASAEEITGAIQAYVVLNRVTGEARVVDAVKPTLEGEFVGFDEVQSLVYVKTATELMTLSLSPTAVIALNGIPVQTTDLEPDVPVQVATNKDGIIVYLHAER